MRAPRRRSVCATVVGLGVTLCASALAAPTPRLSASPNPVRFGQTLTIKGSNWPVRASCQRSVRVMLSSDQNEFLIGFSRLSADGRFVRRWVPRASRVGAASWQLVARLRCEGAGGTTTFVRRSLRVRITT